MNWPLIIAVWIVCGALSAIIAQSRRAGALTNWFLYGVLFGPFGVIYALVSAKPSPDSSHPQPQAIPVTMMSPIGSGLTVADELTKLIGLREAGELTPAEFARQRVILMAANATAAPTALPLAQSWVAPPPAAPTIVGQTASQGRTSAEKFVIGLIAVAVIGGAVLLLNGGRVPSVTGGVGPAGLPPAGSIWFGSSFDAGTFRISGRLTTVNAHQGFSFVAHLTRTMDASALAVRTWFDGQLVATVPVNATGTSDVWGFSPGPLIAAGEWKYELTDIGGNVLASGTITATE